MSDFSKRLEDIAGRAAKATKGQKEAGWIIPEDTEKPKNKADYDKIEGIQFAVMVATGAQRLGKGGNFRPFLEIVDGTTHDADFYAHAYEDIPWLISVIKKLKERDKEMRLELQKICEDLKNGDA